jgi:molecular chaperone GrpE
MSTQDTASEPSASGHDETSEFAPAQNAPPQDAPGAPQTPDQLMQAASGRITELQTELGDMRDRWLRAEAEMQNVRSRAKRDVDDARQYAVQNFARDIAEAVENLRRGLDSIPAATTGESEIIARLREGFAGVERNFVAVLERNGIKCQDPTGATFDPNLHQAMAEQETADHPPGTVLQAWTQSWTLHGRLLRPAMVVVAKAPAGAIDGPGEAAQKLDTSA